MNDKIQNAYKKLSDEEVAAIKFQMSLLWFIGIGVGVGITLLVQKGLK